MRRVLRTVLACLLLVAVPLQGYAAAGMLFCGTANGTVPVPTTVHDHGDAVPSHDVSPPHAHERSAAAGHADHADHADDAAGPHHDHGACSVCASCCSAAALPAHRIASSAEAPQSSPFLDHSTADAGHGPARLERPPRLILA